MPKRIVICCDGTWNTPDQTDKGKRRPSNVTKIALMAAPRDGGGKEQVVYYDKGVGTDWYDRISGGISGAGISKNITDAYRFLVDKYDDGDELFFFGFSRGAYTVRSLAGLIRNSGLLKKENASLVKEAYDLYRRRDDLSHPASVEATLFRKTYSREIRIKFIGVWDTVGALGIPVQNVDVLNRLLDVEFHDVKLSSYVDNAFQALATDEKRSSFKPCIWERQPHAGNQRMEQAWFAGAHTNVGGGYVDSGLSDIALTWLKEKAESCGLAFDDRPLAAQNITIACDCYGVIRNSKKSFYRLLPDYVRNIGVATNGNEIVHPEAKKRYDNDKNYRPANLKKYFEAH